MTPMVVMIIRLIVMMTVIIIVMVMMVVMVAMRPTVFPAVSLVPRQLALQPLHCVSKILVEALFFVKLGLHRRVGGWVRG